MPTLKQLQNEYVKKCGIIERNYLFKSVDIDHKNLEHYHLVIQTLVKVSEVYLSAEKNEREGCESFMRELIKAGGTPDVLIVQAAAHFAKESKLRAESKQIEMHNPEKALQLLCEEWSTTIDQAMNFAAMEFVTDMSRVGKLYWNTGIEALLRFNANPDYRSDENLNLCRIYGKHWIIDVGELNSAYYLLLASAHVRLSLELLESVLKKCKTESHSRVLLKNYLLKVKIEENTIFCENPVIELLLKYYDIAFIRESVRSASQAEILKPLVMAEDFSSIDKLFDKSRDIGNMVFNALLEKPEKVYEEDTAWVDTPIFQYMHNNYRTIISERLSSDEAKFQLIQKLFDENGNTVDREAKVSSRRSGRILNWKNVNNDKESIIFLRKQYEINVVEIIMNSLYQLTVSQKSTPYSLARNPQAYNWLEETFPDDMLAYMIDKSKLINNPEGARSFEFGKLANRHNVDFLQYAQYVSYVDDSNELSRFYVDRCKLILEYLQNNPDLQSIVLMPHKQPLVKVLQVTINSSYISRKYADICKNAKASIDTAATPAHRQVFEALAGYLNNDLPLSKYVNTQFNYIKECGVFMMGMASVKDKNKPNESTLQVLCKNKLYDANVLRHIFGFVGKCGVMNEKVESKESKSEHKLTNS